MTNKELLDEISGKMKDLHDEREKKLKEVEKSEFSDWLKKQMRKEIMDNFYAKMEEFKERPWYDDAIKSARHEWSLRWKLKQIEKKRDKIQKEYEEAQIAHRGKNEQKITEDEGIAEDLEISEDLKDYRQAWQEKIKYIDGGVKENIVKAAEKIKVNVEIESDWSRLIEFKLWEKKWKILDSKLNSHTNQSDAYVNHVNYDSVTNIKKDYVKLRWMGWDKVDDWDNEELAAYVKEKQQEWLHIPSENEMKKLLAELGKEINSDELSHQIAMLMYLTGMDWRYWLSMRNSDSRSLLICLDFDRYFYCHDFANDYASLCMIACE